MFVDNELTNNNRNSGKNFNSNNLNTFYNKKENQKEEIFSIQKVKAQNLLIY